MKKIVRTSTVPQSLNTFCKGMLKELSQEYEVVICAGRDCRARRGESNRSADGAAHLFAQRLEIAVADVESAEAREA